MTNSRPAKGPEWFLTYGVGNRLSGWCATAKAVLEINMGLIIPIPPRRPDDIHGRIPTLERMGDRTDRDVVRHSRHSIVGRCGSRIPYFRCVERLQSNPLNAKEVCDVESGL